MTCVKLTLGTLPSNDEGSDVHASTAGSTVKAMFNGALEFWYRRDDGTSNIVSLTNSNNSYEEGSVQLFEVEEIGHMVTASLHTVSLQTGRGKGILQTVVTILHDNFALSALRVTR